MLAQVLMIAGRKVEEQLATFRPPWRHRRDQAPCLASPTMLILEAAQKAS